MRSEAKARILINELLRRAAWRFFSDETGPANIVLEAHVKLKKKTLDDFGADFEKTAHGFVDYLLLDDRGFPMALLEAKSERFDPLVGKEQARKYARSQNVRFVILSNGNLHYFWDLEQGSPTDFDLLISDEAHRSISGNSRAVFEYFIGYKLGLTATPRDYLKKIDPARISERDPREWERRQLLDTYKTFGCESGAPTFRYSLIDGFREDYLLNPIVVDARTEITTELLTEDGSSVMQANEDGELEEQTYFGRDFERKFFSGNLFDKPEEFFNLDKLRKAVQLDRRLTLREIIEKIFGALDRFKSKDELLEEELAKFISIHKPDAVHMPAIRQFFKAHVTDGSLRAVIESREFSRLADNPKVSLADFRALDEWRDVIPEYVKDYVSLNQFM